MSMVRRLGFRTAAAVATAALALGATAGVAAADDPSGADNTVLDVVDSVLSGDAGAAPLTPPPDAPPGP